ncbi:MAG: hypothetical protein II695_04090 [Oscillospiraceae bacterium]|nr:hypothetical protein [Oscillospiraceae bacterium]
MINTVDILNRGMECLTEGLGVVEAEQFISVIIRERFDYTRWQREYFDGLAPGEFHDKAIKYAKDHPYNGDAERL